MSDWRKEGAARGNATCTRAAGSEGSYQVVPATGQVMGKEIITIEGLRRRKEPDVLQKAYREWRDSVRGFVRPA